MGELPEQPAYNRLQNTAEQQPHNQNQGQGRSLPRYLRRIGRRLSQNLPMDRLAPAMPLRGSAYSFRLRRIQQRQGKQAKGDC